jgi:hypothetical protein
MPHSQLAYVIHYHGTDDIKTLLLTFLFFPLGGCLCAPWPLKVPGDNPSTSPTENEFMKKGCYDRERQPPHVAKWCAGIQYTGMCGLAALLQWFFNLGFINIFLTLPTIEGKGMVGAPVVAPTAYGATANASGAVRASAAERGSRQSGR